MLYIRILDYKFKIVIFRHFAAFAISAKMISNGLKLVFFGIFCIHQTVCSTTVVSSRKFGQIHGLTKAIPSLNGNDSYISMFLGIPYALPPTGERRFRKSEPIQQMQSPYNATGFGNQCIQFNEGFPGHQSEDCLFLNIYVPSRQPDSNMSYAVAIWIHGGSYLFGSGNIYDGTFMAYYGDVIVVTINYRLGLYGFLSTEDDNAPGNNAYWDQHMAFQWVHNNIEDFGGDNKRVTIFGESAGAISAIQQGFITQNRDLFQRIIAQSGSALMPVFQNVDKNALEDAQRLGKGLGCNLTPQELMACLRTKSNEDILNALKTNEIMPDSFEHVIDDVLIKRDVKSLLSHTDAGQTEELQFFRSLDVINGFNSLEGVYIYKVFNQVDNIEIADISRERMEKQIYVALSYLFESTTADSLLEMVMAQYTNWSNPDSKKELYLQLFKFYGDVMFGTPAIKTAYIHSDNASGNYLYYFAANPSIRVSTFPDWIIGANHADEIFFVFGIETLMNGSNPETNWEIQLSRKMVRYWTNFMKSGNPNEPDDVFPEWQKYDTDTQYYLTLEENTTDESVKQNLYARETNFWYNVVPGIKEALERRLTNVTECEDTTSSSAFVSPLTKVYFVFGIVLAFIIYF